VAGLTRQVLFGGVIAAIGAIIMLTISTRDSRGEPGDAPQVVPAPAVDVSPTTQPGAARSAVFAGGCFWCVEAVFEQLDGVKEAVSGYAGGDAKTATYKQVCSGQTGHAEAVRITYDPSRITYGRLLQVFFSTHDPTTRNRQGPDSGSQYRSAIFYADDEEKRVAQAYIRQLDEARAFARPIVTTIEPLKGFYTAEQYHQDFARNNPTHGYVEQWIAPKIQKTCKLFGQQARPTTRP
jgi:methionine-S-sulfoxide reductase